MSGQYRAESPPPQRSEFAPVLLNDDARAKPGAQRENSYGVSQESSLQTERQQESGRAGQGECGISPAQSGHGGMITVGESGGKSRKCQFAVVPGSGA